jgi:hypothetical protein
MRGREATAPRKPAAWSISFPRYRTAAVLLTFGSGGVVAVRQLDGDLHVLGFQTEMTDNGLAATLAGPGVLKLAKTTDGSKGGDAACEAFGPGVVPHSMLPSPYSISSCAAECQTTCSCEVAITLPARTGATIARTEPRTTAIRAVTPIPLDSWTLSDSLNLSSSGMMPVDETVRRPSKTGIDTHAQLNKLREESWATFLRRGKNGWS